MFLVVWVSAGEGRGGDYTTLFYSLSNPVSGDAQREAVNFFRKEKRKLEKINTERINQPHSVNGNCILLLPNKENSF